MEERAGNGKVESCQRDTIPPGKRNAAAAGKGTYTIGSSASMRWAGGNYQLPRLFAHSSAAEQMPVVPTRSPFSVSAGTKV